MQTYLFQRNVTKTMQSFIIQSSCRKTLKTVTKKLALEPCRLKRPWFSQIGSEFRFWTMKSVLLKGRSNENQILSKQQHWKTQSHLLNYVTFHLQIKLFCSRHKISLRVLQKNMKAAETILKTSKLSHTIFFAVW